MTTVSAFFEAEQRAETAVGLRQIQTDLAVLTHRVDLQEQRISRATIVASAAAIVGGLFGLVDFVLLLQVIGRLS